MLSLAVETSCDETSAAVLENEKVLSNVISSQLFHSEFGGVIPEIASREHILKITEITESALSLAGRKISDIELISATSEPGLIGALLVGLNFGKSLAMCLNIPFLPVNHIHSHLYSNFLGSKPENYKFPFISLIVSGGHTLLILAEDFFKHKILGRTVDDAAGEAFDKAGKLLGLGYPGGPLIDKLALTGNISFHKFPLAYVKNSRFDFSFSGVKTSLLYFLKEINFESIKNEKLLSDICASYQNAIVSSLFEKTLLAAKENKVRDIKISGGVSANSGLQKEFRLLEKSGYRISFPEPLYSTDNAAMIGLTGYLKYKHSDNKEYFMKDSLNQNAVARLDYENF